MFIDHLVYCLFISDGYAPFMSLSDRDTMLVNDSILAVPSPGTYDPKIPQDIVKVLQHLTTLLPVNLTDFIMSTLLGSYLSLETFQDLKSLGK